MGQVFEFLVITIGLKMIVGHWIAERITTFIKWMITLTPRQNAIWTHFQERAQEHGHQSDDVTECSDGDCSIFQSA